MDDRFDNILFSILKEAKTIPNFFDVVFGFLFRRTDFYHISADPNLGVGLPEGVAEKLLLQSYSKYIVDCEASSSVIVEDIAKEEIVTTENEVTVEDSSGVEQNCQSESSKVLNSCVDSYNGAVYENYSWSQTISDVDFQVKIPENTTSKQLFVNITSSQATVKLKNSSITFLEGELCKKCKPLETIWSLDGNILQIHLEKSYEAWWNCLLQSEPKLDFSKMDCSRPFHELSDEAQAKIEELTWNQERKRQGLATSNELELENTLKKAWNSEGSPFVGPYDPSKVSLS